MEMGTANSLQTDQAAEGSTTDEPELLALRPKPALGDFGKTPTELVTNGPESVSVV